MQSPLSTSVTPIDRPLLLQLPTDVLRHFILRAGVLDTCSRAVCRFVCRRLRDLIPATSPDFFAAPAPNSTALNFLRGSYTPRVPHGMPLHPLLGRHHLRGPILP
jgi:hypothetical protein